MMVGNNLKDGQLQQIVDKTIMYSDQDGDGKISFEEFVQVCYKKCSRLECLYRIFRVFSCLYSTVSFLYC